MFTVLSCRERERESRARLANLPKGGRWVNPLSSEISERRSEAG
jgi:hypothetical protein